MNKTSPTLYRKTLITGFPGRRFKALVGALHRDYEAAGVGEHTIVSPLATLHSIKHNVWETNLTRTFSYHFKVDKVIFIEQARKEIFIELNASHDKLHIWFPKTFPREKPTPQEINNFITVRTLILSSAADITLSINKLRGICRGK